MPLDEEGAKWSCEPCIRGHRSSKCQHFDRMMMKVPKAGRPLARCPHPKGTCSCQKLYAFMVRIPKGSTCLCRPVYQVPAEAAESISTTPAPPTPTPSSAPNKIQKSVKRQIKTAPENLTKALSSIPEFRKQHAEGGMSNRPYPYAYSAQEQRPNNSYDAVNEDPNESVATSRQASNQIGESKASQGSSCCSRKPQPPVQTPAPVQRSCCEKPKSSPESVDNRGPILDSPNYLPPHIFNGNGTSHTPNPTPQVSTWQDFQVAKQEHYMQPFSLPLSQSGLLSMPGGMAHMAPHPVEFSHQPLNGHGIFQTSTSNPPSESTRNVPNPEDTECDATHNCTCGDKCQCLGCVSHPFNNTTRQHVQEMGLLVALTDDEQKQRGLNSHRSSPLQGQQGQQGQQSQQGQQDHLTSLPYQYSNFAHPTDHGARPIGMHSYANHSPTLGNVNNGYASPPADYLSGQQLMVPSEYYTLEYPVGLPSACADTTGSCQCGNDCTCVGCLTHSGHNGIGLEPTMENNWGHMDFSTFSTDTIGVSTSQMPAFEDFIFHPTNSML
ncbi:hypothetical protein BO70DRAFT_68226 [Aspergillus heteromorphus CBS 117.55]|uniref:Copper-fist domain-containing protein n=1 Tax=Aspergillus heteromorphus CBS 117.55 TaxID=1448321 RepID=A0A317VT56_9EURO|nr:uncharacterized protein BO70DRAFT_68226 [Aspergillus heteromorphus CBS 117.55]PWY77506.1 hypothetical protein BO70DRAFT_68226 [Aspergillus heteromorphus CBS 117.55]